MCKTLHIQRLGAAKVTSHVIFDTAVHFLPAHSWLREHSFHGTVGTENEPVPLLGISMLVDTPSFTGIATMPKRLANTGAGLIRHENWCTTSNEHVF